MKLKPFLLRFALAALLMGGILLYLNFNDKDPAEAVIEPTTEKTTVEITGAVADKADAAACLEVLKANLAAANNEDSAAYVDTLVASARQATQKEMAAFFADYDLSHELESFNVVKQDTDSMLVEAQQKTVNRGKQKYRNHFTQAHHTFVKEDGAWKIQETNMTNTEFID